jgi:hypothetical protein
MKLKLMPFLSLLVLVAACNLGDINLKNIKYKNVVKNATFKVSIPEFMDSSTKLNNDATLQFSNPKKEFYMILFCEDKENVKANLQFDTLSNITDSFAVRDAYFSYMVKHMREQPDFKMFNESNKMIKKTNAKLASMNLSFKKNRIFYRVAAFETNTNLYQFFIWTMDKQKATYEPVMDSIINSLTEF